MELFKVTNTELRKKNPSEFGEKALIDIFDARSKRHIYVIHLEKSEEFKNSKTPYGWESLVEDAETFKFISCIPGPSKGFRPYYIDEFLHRN